MKADDLAVLHVLILVGVRLSLRLLNCGGVFYSIVMGSLPLQQHDEYLHQEPFCLYFFLCA